MTVVFGVDFDLLSPDLADALCALDSHMFRIACIKSSGRPDARIVPAGSDATAAISDAADSIVAIGNESFEVESLEAGAVDYVVWPSLNQSLGAQFIASARRIGRVREQEDEFARLRRLDTVRLRIAEADVDVGTLAQLVCDEMLASDGLGTMTRADGAIVELIDEGQRTHYAAGGSIGAYKGGTTPLAGTFTERVIDGGEILICDDTETDERVDVETCRTAGIRSMAAAPLVADGKAVGALKLVSSEPSAFGVLDKRILLTMSAVVSAALGREIARQRLRADLDRRAEALKKLEAESVSLRRLAATDPLTGLLNRRQFVIAADEALRRGAGRRPGVAVLMIDLDQFKAINDAHGHAAGDAVLVAVANALTATLRDGDILGRVGGEEFAVVLTRVDLDQSITAAERVRAAIEGAVVTFKGATLRTTASIGLATVTERIDQEEAFRRADSALYRAKTDGRNRVVIHRDADVMTFPGRAAVT